MWIKTSCRLELDYVSPTQLILMLRPRSGASQWVSSETYELSQQVEVVEYTDQYGNLCQRLIAPKGGFVIETSATVNTPDLMDMGAGDPFVDISRLPDETLRYLVPSRYCESDRFGGLALEIAGPSNSGYDQVERIVDWIRE
ncbi:MAG: transglutaminase family protein, partial [Gammaproteobacteria bacterium]|nr:transglutaminase family protein [Gammaproteobacteria bacterium]